MTTEKKVGTPKRCTRVRQLQAHRLLHFGVGWGTRATSADCAASHVACGGD